MADNKEKKEPGKETVRAYVRYVRDPVFAGLIVLCLLLGMMAMYFAAGGNSKATCPTGAAVTGGAVVTGGDNTTVENVNTKLVMYEFSDFTCPYCAAAGGHNPTLEDRFKQQDPTWEPAVPGVKRDFANDVEVVYKHYLIHGDQGKKAAEAMECARDQGKAWEMYDIMFENMAKLGASDLKSYAQQIGLDSTKFDACLDNGDKAGVVQADADFSADFDMIGGTPAFIVLPRGETDLGDELYSEQDGSVIVYENGFFVGGAFPYSTFKALIENELDPAKKAQKVSEVQAAQANAQAAFEEALATQIGLVKGDNKPQIDFFVMSYCPYGNIAEEAIEPVYQNLKDKAIFNPRYIVSKKSDGTYNSLHGVQEFNQDIRELCVNKYMGIDKYFKFVLAMNKACSSSNADTCWEAVAEGLGLDTAKIKTCEKDEAAAMADKEIAATQALKVSGSPTVFIDGVKYGGARTPAGYQESLCAAYETAPPECGTQLSGEAAAATGNC